MPAQPCRADERPELMPAVVAVLMPPREVVAIPARRRNVLDGRINSGAAEFASVTSTARCAPTLSTERRSASRSLRAYRRQSAAANCLRKNIRSP